MLTLETIMKDAMWVAKMQDYRVTGTYEEIKHLGQSSECRDFDLLAKQPTHLVDFFDKYFAHEGFITIQDFYHQYYNPEKVEKPKRVWTEEEIRTLVQTNDKVLYGALKKLYSCQTETEKACGDAIVQNGAGFNGADAPILTSFVGFLKKTGFLTYKQKALARKKLVKYTKQLTRLANC